MKSVMSHQFSQVPRADIQRSKFDRSHGVKTTFDSGYLIPVFVDEALPGDTFNLRTTGFARLATPIYPVMDNINLDTFYFSVPVRLVWDNFKRMMGEQRNPKDSTDFICPVVKSPVGGFEELSLFDYFGIPTKVPNLSINATFSRAYNLIWNEWFRDQNLQDSVVVDLDDTDDDPADYVLLKRGKRHDYFTSALPWPQKGPSVDLGLSGNAPVGFASGVPGDTVNVSQHGSSLFRELGTAGPRLILDADVSENSRSLTADMNDVTAVTINQLRTAFQVQKMLEKDARGGTRYIEMIRSHFGVTSPDARLQRPEYLGGGSSRVNITPVAQTSGSDGSTVQGNLAAMGTVSFQGNGFVKSFTEHCVIIGMVCVRADLTYQQGLNRMFTRSDKLDFYWPALSHLGEQTIVNREIFAQGSAVDDEVFGYQERYAEYRYKPSTIHGRFRSNSAVPLDAWHLSQHFADLPILGPKFIEDSPPIARVIAVPDEPEFIADFYHHLVCARPMPMYGEPGMIDHF
ncbi:MAG: major capsid protein [Microviridae sp.]|nr:MAG: major capsid protein [Microviridae sp.]